MGDTNMARVVSRRESSTCTLPRNLLTRAGWRTGEIVTFSFGSAKRRIRVQGGEMCIRDRGRSSVSLELIWL